MTHMHPRPRFVVVSFAREQAEVVLQGFTSGATFQRLFLDSYVLEGERYQAVEDSAVRGALLASWESIFVTLPIRTWTGEDGSPRFLCQATDDGRAPALSVLAVSESKLLDRLDELLSQTATGSGHRSTDDLALGLPGDAQADDV